MNRRETIKQQDSSDAAFLQKRCEAEHSLRQYVAQSINGSKEMDLSSMLWETLSPSQERALM